MGRVFAISFFLSVLLSLHLNLHLAHICGLDLSDLDFKNSYFWHLAQLLKQCFIIKILFFTKPYCYCDTKKKKIPLSPYYMYCKTRDASFFFIYHLNRKWINCVIMMLIIFLIFMIFSTWGSGSREVWQILWYVVARCYNVYIVSKAAIS